MINAISHDILIARNSDLRIIHNLVQNRILSERQSSSPFEVNDHIVWIICRNSVTIFLISMSTKEKAIFH